MREINTISIQIQPYFNTMGYVFTHASHLLSAAATSESIPKLYTQLSASPSRLPFQIRFIFSWQIIL